MEQLNILFFLLAAMLYIGATVLYIYFFATKSRRISVLATFTTGLGFIFQTLAIILRWISLGHPPIQGAFNSLNMIAWWLVLTYFVVEHLVRIKTLGIVMIPCAVVLMAWAGINYEPPTREIAQILRSTQVVLHLAMVFTAYACFTLAAGCAVLYLIQERRLKKKKLLGGLGKRLPPLDVLENLERRAVIVGVPFITVGLVLGMIRAIQFVPNWYLEPLVLLAIFTWAYYGGYLVLRRYAGWAGRRAAWMAIVGLLLISTIRLLALGNWATIFHRYGG